MGFEHERRELFKRFGSKADTVELVQFQIIDVDTRVKFTYRTPGGPGSNGDCRFYRNRISKQESSPGPKEGTITKAWDRSDSRRRFDHEQWWDWEVQLDNGEREWIHQNDIIESLGDHLLTKTS